MEATCAAESGEVRVMREGEGGEGEKVAGGEGGGGGGGERGGGKEGKAKPLNFFDWGKQRQVAPSRLQCIFSAYFSDFKLATSRHTCSVDDYHLFKSNILQTLPFHQ